MSAVQYGVSVVMGVHEFVPPIMGLPKGRVRLRMRQGMAVIAFVSTSDGIESWYLTPVRDYWQAAILSGRNVKNA